MMRAVDFRRAGNFEGTPFDMVVLAHDERHVRRKLLVLAQGDDLLVDLAEPVALQHGDVLVLEDGRLAGVVAGDEDLYAVRGRDDTHLMELCWHLGNRHLPCQIETGGDGKRLLILRDHVIRGMLLGLGAEVSDVSGPFQPVRGAYHASAASHSAVSHSSVSHGHRHRHDHTHGHDHHHHE